MLYWFANLRLRNKVLIAPGIMILVLVGVGSFALHDQAVSQASVNALIVGRSVRLRRLPSLPTPPGPRRSIFIG